MKIRESGMPDANRWETFFEPSAILEELELTATCKKIVDFGCGYGTFTIPAAKISCGIVYAIDIDDHFLAECERRANAESLHTVHCIERDFVAKGTGLPADEMDYVMLFNILHAENPGTILREAYRVLRPGGKAAVIHWNYDGATPRGPSIEIRPRPEQCQDWMKRAGFDLIRPFVDIQPYHYGILGRKKLVES